MNDRIKTVGGVKLDLTDYTGDDRYSDGEEEKKLLKYAVSCTPGQTDRICMDDPSWAVQYHFSSLRENILRWYPIRETDRVLEIGAGCGAVTRTLAQRAKEVVCVDLSRRRSLINANRNRDLKNIRIHVGNFMDTAPHLEGPFDVITLIGVFEYGRSYIEGEHPFSDFLKTVRSLLKEDGSLLIAIENRLGLKYFAGCREDHTGVFFEGIEGYHEGTGVRTFSRPELKALLAEGGFRDPSFYYPYPDYKFPMEMFSDRYLPRAGQLHENMQNFDRDRMLLFDESRVFDSFAGTDLFPVFSNSFFVEAGGRRNAPAFVKFSNERREDLCIRTEILEEDGKWRVRKCPQSDEASGHILALSKHEKALENLFSGTRFSPNRAAAVPEGTEFVYLKGRTLEEILDEKINEPAEFKAGLEVILAEIDKLSDCDFRPDGRFEVVFGEAQGYTGPATSVSDIDLLLSNLIEEDGKWQVIDYEWTFGFPVPTAFLKWRLLHYYLQGNSKRLSLPIGEYLALAGISQEERRLFENWEHAFQLYILGDTMPRAILYEERGAGTIDVHRLVGNYAVYGEAMFPAKQYDDAERILAEKITLGKNIAQYRSERLLRKKRQLEGKPDPFRQFDPDLPSDPEGLCFCLDGTSYGMHGMTVRGWCFDRAFAAQVSVTDDGEHPVPCEVQREVRSDVAAVFGRPAGEAAGFVVRIPEAELGQRLFLRLSSLRGHAAYDLKVITDPAERRRTALRGHESIPDAAYTAYLAGSAKDAADPADAEEKERFLGEFLMTSAEGCRWDENAADVFARAAQTDPEADILYCDDDILRPDGTGHAPFFKPDYSLTYLRATGYIGAAFAVRKQFLEENELTLPSDEAGMYEFLLRASEKTDRFVHIPKVLFHRTKEETGFTGRELADAKRALTEHYTRLGLSAAVKADDVYGLLRTSYALPGDPLVSVLIPNKDHREDLAKCLASCEKAAEGIRCEYLILENNSTQEETFAYYEILKQRPDVRILTYDGAFNYAAVNNFGARQAKGDLLLLLNNDTEWITPGGITGMAAAVLQPGNGAAGARMYFADDTIQHAGVIVGYGGIAGHCFSGQDRLDPGYMKRIVSPGELSAVTGACLMVRADLFRELGGFGEILGIALNDIDLCLRVRKAGYKVLYLPDAELYHYESRSRGYEDSVVKRKRFEREKKIFRIRWAGLLAAGDPYYNPNLTKRLPDFSLPGEDEKTSG